MPPSQRVPIPAELEEAVSLDEMRAAADELAFYDTPQALPVLDSLDRRAPRRGSVAIAFSLDTLILALFGVVIVAALAVAIWVHFIAYYGVLRSISHVQPFWLAICGAMAVLAIIWLITSNEKVHSVLGLEGPAGAVILPPFWSNLVWLVCQCARIAMLVAFLLSLAGLLLPMFYGVRSAATQIWGIQPIYLGRFPALQEHLGLSPEVTLWPVVILVTVCVIAVLLALWARRILALILWGFGMTMVLLSGLDITLIALVAGLSITWPLRVPYFVARPFGRLVPRWGGQVDNLILGWELRNSLDAAFAAHRKRNRQRTGDKGADAVCRRDLAFFVRGRSGPVEYWWCPECRDDDAVYPSVRTIRGVLDVGMRDDYRQDGSALLVNLPAWQGDRGPLISPPLQEVHIGCLGDPHEAEMFITQYHSLQGERGWPPLKRVTAEIAPDSNLDENGRRQVQGNLRLA